MLRRHKSIILIPSTLLILIFFGVPPLNMAQRSMGGMPFAHSKQTHLASHCPFRSLITHDDPIGRILNLTPLHEESTATVDFHFLDPDSFLSNITLNSFPLRC